MFVSTCMHRSVCVCACVRVHVSVSLLAFVCPCLHTWVVVHALAFAFLILWVYACVNNENMKTAQKSDDKIKKNLLKRERCCTDIRDAALIWKVIVEGREMLQCPSHLQSLPRVLSPPSLTDWLSEWLQQDVIVRYEYPSLHLSLWIPSSRTNWMTTEFSKLYNATDDLRVS